MRNYLMGTLLLGAVVGLHGCQQPQATGAQPAAVPATEAAATGATTEAAARAAVGRYVQALPQAALYQLDSARVLEVETSWQVLVPRRDWAGRMPNAAAFEVDKQTGTVTTRAVK